jgi:hypothetical protein
MTSTLRGAQLTTTQPTESVNTALGGVSPPTVIAFSFQWEEALIEAAQMDFQLNSPELNDGIQGTHDVQIMSFQEMMEADDVVMVI